MEDGDDSKLKFARMAPIGPLARLLGKVTRILAVVVALLIVAAVVAYVQLESIIETVDARYSREIDDYLGIHAGTFHGCGIPPTSPSNP